MNKRVKKIVFFLAWMIMLAGSFYLWRTSGVPATDVPVVLKNWVQHFGILAPLVYIALYAVRTLTFFSATVFTIAAGLMFGPVLGIVYTIIAENIAALLAFFVGRYLGSDALTWLTEHTKHFPSGETLRKNGFLSVLTMRLFFFPFDPVGYLSGAYRVRTIDFFLGTLIGTLPGLIAFVALGDILAHPLKSLAIFLPFFIIGILVAQTLKKTKLGKELATIKEQGHAE